MNPKVEWVLKRPRYQRALMLTAVLGVIVGLFMWLLFLPKQEEYTRVLKTSADLQVKLDADRLVAKNLPVFEAELKNMEAQLERALKELPVGREIPKLLTNISARAKTSGLEVLSFRPGEESLQKFYAEVPVALRLEGTFHQFASFLYAVGSLDRIVNINNVKIGLKSSKDGKLNLLSIDCLATTFRFIDSATPPAVKKGR